MEVKRIREDLAALTYKRRKLNAAIQRTNCGYALRLDDEQMSLGEALELQKALNERIGEYHAQVMASAYCKVIYKEDRDIIQLSSVSFGECFDQLEKARQQFRRLNRGIRRAAFESSVGFKDEK